MIRLAEGMLKLLASLYPSKLRADLDDLLRSVSGPPHSEPRRLRRLVWMSSDLIRNLPGAWIDVVRGHWGVSWDMPLRELRNAARGLVRAPAYASTAIGTIALSVCGSAVMFAVVWGVVLQPLSYPDGQDLYMLTTAGEHPGISYPNFADVRERSRSFQDIAAFRIPRGVATFDTGEWPIQLDGIDATASLAGVLGVEPLVGRWFSEVEDRPDGPRVVVVSESFAVRYLGGASSELIGRSLQLEDVGYSIVGVMPSRFSFPHPGIDYWTPLRGELSGDGRERRFGDLSAIARLAPGASAGTARGEVQDIAAALRHDFPSANESLRLDFVSRKQYVVGAVAPRLWLMLAGAILFLLAASSNVAMLTHARTLRRYDALRVRLALGASRVAMARGVMIECLLVAGLGGALGLWLASVAAPSLGNALDGTPRGAGIGVDAWSAAFVAGAVGLVSLVIGLGPVLISLSIRSPGSSELAAISRGTLTRERWLVGFQVGVATLLLLTSTVVVEAFRTVSSTDPGFRMNDVTSLRIDLPRSRYRFSEPRLSFFAEVRARLAEVRGVSQVALTSQVFQRVDDGGRDFTIEGREYRPGQEHSAVGTGVGVGYFETMGIPLVWGRSLTPEDRPDSPPVILINESMASRFWPSEDPVGARIRLGFVTSPDPWLTVVGVVRDLRGRALGQRVVPEFFLPYEQNVEFRSGKMFLLLGTAPGVLIPESEIRAAVAELDPLVAVSDLTTFDRIRSSELAAPLAAARLTSVFAGMTVLLALLGLYGALSLMVSSRAKEIGIKVALGGGRTVAVEILKSAMLVVSLGLIAGVTAAGWVQDVLVSLVLGARSLSPGMVGAVAGSFLLVALVAAAIPAVEASRIDPLLAIRRERS